MERLKRGNLHRHGRTELIFYSLQLYLVVKFMMNLSYTPLTQECFKLSCYEGAIVSSNSDFMVYVTLDLYGIWGECV